MPNTETYVTIKMPMGVALRALPVLQAMESVCPLRDRHGHPIACMSDALMHPETIAVDDDILY